MLGRVAKTDDVRAPDPRLIEEKSIGQFVPQVQNTKGVLPFYSMVANLFQLISPDALTNFPSWPICVALVPGNLLQSLRLFVHRQ
jgi:hypothetical protein